MNVITEEYREQQQKMHEMTRGYGGTNTAAHGTVILDDMQTTGTGDVLLDYGAGKGHLAEWLWSHGWEGEYRPYDPGIPYWSAPPQPADYVACLDVLEHIEPDLLDVVLDDLQRVTRKVGCFVVHHRKAEKTLPDGRNAHLIIQPPEWWQQRLERRFVIRNVGTLVADADKELLATMYMVGAR